MWQSLANLAGLVLAEATEEVTAPDVVFGRSLVRGSSEEPQVNNVSRNQN
jgi:hypothetical protein